MWRFPNYCKPVGCTRSPPLPFIPGAEVAGVVVSAPESSGLVAGDRVCALPLLGGFAEQVVAQTDLTFAARLGVVRGRRVVPVQLRHVLLRAH